MEEIKPVHSVAVAINTGLNKRSPVHRSSSILEVDLTQMLELSAPVAPPIQYTGLSTSLAHIPK